MCGVCVYVACVYMICTCTYVYVYYLCMCVCVVYVFCAFSFDTWLFKIVLSRFHCTFPRLFISSGF